MNRGSNQMEVVSHFYLKKCSHITESRMGLSGTVFKMFMLDCGGGEVLIGSVVFFHESPFLQFTITWITDSSSHHNGCCQVVFFVLLIGCIKHCDIIIEYSRILLLTLHADWSWRRDKCSLMKLCPSEHILVTNASKLKSFIFHVGQNWQTQFHGEKQGACQILGSRVDINLKLSLWQTKFIDDIIFQYLVVLGLWNTHGSHDNHVINQYLSSKSFFGVSFNLTPPVELKILRNVRLPKLLWV